MKVSSAPNFHLQTPNFALTSNLASVPGQHAGTETYWPKKAKIAKFRRLFVRQRGGARIILTSNSNSPYPKPPCHTFLGSESPFRWLYGTELMTSWNSTSPSRNMVQAKNNRRNGSGSPKKCEIVVSSIASLNLWSEFFLTPALCHKAPFRRNLSFRIVSVPVPERNKYSSFTHFFLRGGGGSP